LQGPFANGPYELLNPLIRLRPAADRGRKT